MKIEPGMFTQSVIKYIEQGKNKGVDRSLAGVMFALTLVIDLITFPLTYPVAIVDGLISLSNKKSTPDSIRNSS